MPGRPSVRTAKSSCFGKISTRIGPFGVKLYFGRQRLQRFLRERHRVFAHHRRFRRVQLQDDVPFADLDELVECVEQREQVVRDLVVGVDLERALERLTRLRFVAGAHQVHAEFGMGPRVRRIEASPLRAQD